LHEKNVENHVEYSILSTNIFSTRIENFEFGWGIGL